MAQLPRQWWMIETEADWLAATIGIALTNNSHCRDPRRRRLLACAAVRPILPHIAGDVFRRAVDMAERFAEGWAAANELARLRHEIMTGRKTHARDIRHRSPEWHAYQAVECLTRYKTTNILEVADHVRRVEYAFRNSTGHWVDMGTEDYVCYVRDIFGNPFRPVPFEPCWRVDTATALARQMYESRDFSIMPILADALEGAGCHSDAVLNHCRKPQGIHVRGCWVVDLVLAKN